MLAWHNTLINEVKIEHLISACRTITHDTIHNGAAFVYNRIPKIQKCKNHLIHSVLAIVWNSSKLFLFLYLTLYLYTLYVPSAYVLRVFFSFLVNFRELCVTSYAIMVTTTIGFQFCNNEHFPRWSKISAPKIAAILKQ